MRKCVVIINPKSGRGIDDNILNKFQTIIENYNYDVKIILTKYRKHAEKLF